MKDLTQSQFCLALLKMPDADAADQLLREWAAHSELDVSYVRWFVLHWFKKFEPTRLDAARQLIDPKEHAESLKRRALRANRSTPEPTP